MVTCHATLSTLYQQSQSAAIISWAYSDDSTGEIINPSAGSPFTGKLFDLNGVQRSPTDTNTLTAATFVPTRDTTGSVTGTIGKFYVTVNFHSAAPTGKWYVTVDYVWESIQRQQNICFNVIEAGASVSGDAVAGTVPVYAMAKDVENWLMLGSFIDRNSTPSSDVIDNYIVMAEGEFEARTGTAFKPRLVTNEVHDFAAWRQRHRDFMDELWFAVPRPIGLGNRPVLPFDSTRGHKIEIYEGSETEATAADPIRRWTDWVSGKTYGRQNDFWFDEMGGKLYVRKAFLFRRGQVARITYEYGKPITTTTSVTNISAATIPVTSTHRYETRGIVRIGTEYIHHTSKTSTSFTGCRRGLFGTTVQQHSANSEVYEVPDHVRQLVSKRAAALFLQNEVFVAVAGDNAGTAPSFSDKVRAWNEDWERELASTWQRWEEIG